MATVSPRHRTAPTDAPTVESTTLGASRPPNRATTGISLRVKTLSVVLVTLVVPLLIGYMPLYYTQQQSVLEIERQLMSTDIERVRQVLDFKIEQLDTLLVAYSIWDSTYAYAETRDPSYIESNFYQDMFTQFNLNILMIYDSQGQLVYGTHVDLLTGHQSEPPLDLQIMLAGISELLQFSDTNAHRSGLLALRSGLLQVAARPIVRSDGSGPTNGTIVFGRFLDETEIAHEQALTQFPFTITTLEHAPVAQSGHQANVLVRRAGGDIMLPVDDATMEGFGLHSDMLGHPELLIRVERPRVLYAEVKRSLANLAIAFCVAAGLIGFILMVMIERVVLARLLGLGTLLRTIGDQGNLAARVYVEGRDELADLGRSVNVMLGQLEQTEQRRQLAERERLAALQQVNQQLHTNLAERQRVERLKSEFVSVVSHELRTPLTSIRGALGLVNGGVTGELPTQARDMLLIAQSNSERLIRMINDILDIEKIEAGKLSLDLQPLSLRALLEQALAEHQGYAARCGVAIVLEADSDVELQLDRDRMLQVLANLLSNATKFSPSGTTIALTMRCEQEQVCIHVRDHGSGIPIDFHDRIFQKFAQADASDTRQKGGSGLGLSITRALVEGMGGTVGFACPPERGTVFTITFGNPLGTTSRLS